MAVLGRVSLMLMLRFMGSPPCPKQATSSNFMTPNDSGTLHNVAEKAERLIPAARNMNSVGSTQIHLRDDWFVPGIQYKWDAVPSCEPDTSVGHPLISQTHGYPGNQLMPRASGAGHPPESCCFLGSSNSYREACLGWSLRLRVPEPCLFFFFFFRRVSVSPGASFSGTHQLGFPTDRKGPQILRNGRHRL